MNFRKGFFRAWLLLALIWFGVTIYSTTEPADAIAAYHYLIGNQGPTPWKFMGADAQDIATVEIYGTKYEIGAKIGETPFVKLDVQRQQQIIEAFGSTELVSAKKRALDAARFRLLHRQLATVFLPPFVLLVLGIAIAWVVSGFSIRAFAV